MELAAAWKDVFVRWPDSLDRNGIVVTNFDEQIVFTGFMASEAMLLIERATPDASGARKVILPYDNILALKIVDIVKGKTFLELGFEGNLTVRRK
jgi:hypothetical protein